MKNLRNVTLELSAKALHDPSPEAMERVARTMFRQWRSLTELADQVSVLLWVADGSELLDWSGTMSDTFEWACWCGCANPFSVPENPTPRQRRNTFAFPAKVFPDAECAPRPYSWLRDAVATVRAAARAELGRDVRVGTILDAGPEFVHSDFKFRRHPEVMPRGSVHPRLFLACDATLTADSHRYAAFPDGIPEGLSFGAFLGAQYRDFSRAFGFDYLWLSNGLGFGDQPWGVVGSLFDGHAFQPGRAPKTTGRMLGFWRDFFAACPDAVVETRGSNSSAGVEMATDAAPLGALYAEGLIDPPVNSPWAAINFRTGLELAAWMSHVAELPRGRGFPFRFYIHDPWFLNSPWLDRYGRQPWDIFAPLSICRIREDGSVQTPDSVALLSVDDTLGRMPEVVPREVTPFLAEAFETAPDRAGPLVWVYPFGEYAAASGGAGEPPPGALDRIFNEDVFLGEALQGGLPLNTVVSTRIWRALAARSTPPVGSADTPLSEGGIGQGHPPSERGVAQSAGGSTAWFKDADTMSVVFVVPVAALLSAENLAALDAHAARGARFLVYGALAGAPEPLLERLGLALGEPKTGEVTVRLSESLPVDAFESGAPCERLFVRPELDGGGLAEVEAGAEPFAWAETSDGARRILASRKGAFAFVRSALPLSEQDTVGIWHFCHAPATGAFPSERLMRHLLGAATGWRIRANLTKPSAPPPRTNLSRHDNAFLFHVFAPDTTASLRVRTPLGAPLVTEYDTRIEDGDALWRPGKSWRPECRLFADGQESGTVTVKTSFAAFPGFTGRLHLTGLKCASLRFFPPDGFRETTELVRNGDMLDEVSPTEWEETPFGPCAVWRDLSGSAYIAW